MNEEEKKAIEDVNEFIEYSQQIIDDMEYERPVDVTIYQYNISAINTILNLIEKLQAEIEKKDKIIDELAIMVFDSRQLTYVDEEQYNQKKKEIIEYAEGQANGKAM